MQIQKISFEATRAFAPFFLDYIHQKESLQSFYNRFPTTKNLHNQLSDKATSFPESNRSILVESLEQQYKDFDVSEQVKSNLQKLKHKNTFTVTTGHQLNIFTGPLYFIYKIVTVINTCRKLKETYPHYDFVPVYWMASRIMITRD